VPKPDNEIRVPVREASLRMMLTQSVNGMSLKQPARSARVNGAACRRLLSMAAAGEFAERTGPVSLSGITVSIPCQREKEFFAVVRDGIQTFADIRYDGATVAILAPAAP
jgi:hypothetical protein